MATETTRPAMGSAAGNPSQRAVDVVAVVVASIWHHRAMQESWWAQQIGPPVWPRRRLSRSEWAVALVVAVLIVVVNKAVVHDTGNTWGTLVILSIAAGILATLGGSWVLHKARSN